MIIDGFDFKSLRPADLIVRYAVTIYVNGSEMSTELVSDMPALADRISEINHIIRAGDEILLHIQALDHLKHITGMYRRSENA